MELFRPDVLVKHRLKSKQKLSAISGEFFPKIVNILSKWYSTTYINKPKSELYPPCLYLSHSDSLEFQVHVVTYGYYKSEHEE